MRQTITLILFMITTAIFSQEFQVPCNAKLDAAEDFKKYEPDIIKAINWLENTSVAQQKDKRVQVNAFFMRWIIGTPSVSISMQTFQTELAKKNSALLISFMGRWTKHVIENPSEKDNMLANNLAGIQSIIKVYNANKGNGMKKDKKIEKIIKMNSSELEQWIKDQI